MTAFQLELEKEILFDKTFICPNCNEEVKAKTVKTGKAKLESTDDDLRPKYNNIDQLKYDGILCNCCGYASIRKFFTEKLVPVQKKYISEKITSVYQPMTQELDAFSYEEAIRRHKLAYISCLAKNSDSSEQAYTCLKTAWLYRGYQEELIKSGEKEEAVLEQLKDMEGKFIRSAYLGFKEAYISEETPTCGMDEATFFYLIASLAYKEEDYQECSRWLSQVLSQRDASDRVKNRARDLKELVKLKTQEQRNTYLLLNAFYHQNPTPYFYGIASYFLQ